MEKAVPTLEGMKRRLDATEQLQSVVKTMKALAAVSIRQYEEAVAALSDYTRTIELGFHVLLRDPRGRRVAWQPGPTAPLGAIVYGSDQGMCGQFNEQLVRHAVETMHAMDVPRHERKVLAVGERAAATLESADQAVERMITLPGSTSGITPVVQRLLPLIEEWRERHGIASVVLFHNAYEQTSYTPTMRRLLPLDPRWLSELQARPWSTHCLPAFSMDWEELFAALVRHHLFAVLYQALVESLAAENASRLRSMQAAERNIEERLDELRGRYHRARQSAITAELLDIVVGSESLGKETSTATTGDQS
jgi:F-type H+-transporting ATPase subunit gamma